MPHVAPQIRCIILSSIFLLLPAAAAPHFIQPFPLSAVHLHESSDFRQGQALNHEYLLLLDTDNLLYNFRTTAGLPAPGQSYGGWEGSSVEVRGQFIGHYLSALAFAHKNTANEEFRKRGTAVVDGLAECQAAHGNGYLSAFPSSHFDRLEALQPVWAPYYVIHKILQGLLDQYQLSEQPSALAVLLKMAGYFCDRSEKVVKLQGMEHWHQVLENEFGGMEDTLYQIYRQHLDPRWARCAELFIKPTWFEPLAQGKDVLAGLHANTHLAQVNGFVSRFEATGNEEAAAAVAHFYKALTSAHSYSSGGSNDFERWGDPHALGDAIDNPDAAANTQESCTTYNILKIARALFRWTGIPAYADFYERALVNGVLGVQRTAHPGAAASSHHHHHQGIRSTMHNSHPYVHNSNEESSISKRSTPSREELAAISISNAVHVVNPRPANYLTVAWPDDPAPALVQSYLARQHISHTNATTSSIDDEAGQPGQYIYYLPLGHEGGKGENPKAWTHGWGDRFNTFWCCYGTAVESFSKLADSIYFHWSPPAPKAPAGAVGGSTFWEKVAAAVTAAAAAAFLKSDGPRRYRHDDAQTTPSLFINQLVSSTLRWGDLGVTLKQTADLYGDHYKAIHSKSTETSGNGVNVATSKIELSIEPFPSSQDIVNGKLYALMGTHCAAADFHLHWRVPSWVGSEKKVQVRINGQDVDLKTVPRSSSRNTSFSPFLKDLHPPEFGKGAEYLILGPHWKHGDTLEFELPMRVAVEDLNDPRPQFKSLKAITMGPFHMVALTDEGDRTIDILPEDIPGSITLVPKKDKKRFPKGARMLSGKNKTYVIAPLGQVVDEKYSAYLEFEMVPPSLKLIKRRGEEEEGAVEVA